MIVIVIILILADIILLLNFISCLIAVKLTQRKHPDDVNRLFLQKRSLSTSVTFLISGIAALLLASVLAVVLR